MRISRFLMVATAMTLSAGTIQAQTACAGTTSAPATSCEVTSDVDLAIPYLANASVTGLASAVTITAANLDAGYVEVTTGPSVAVKANYGWELKVDASVTGKAKAEIQIKESSASSYTSFGSQAVVLKDGAATSGTTVNTSLKVLLDWAKDGPGEPAATLTFTVVAK